jgi:hypothetical protein
MRIPLILFLSLLQSHTLIAQLLPDKKPVYNKEIVYCYELTHTDAGHVTHKKSIHLVCYATPWKLDSLKQCKVNWVYQIEKIHNKTFGTGVIENTNRVWMHPPRQYEFSILEYSPFPFVKFPIVINSKWNWELSLGKSWANQELGVLPDDVMKYEYHLDAETALDVPFLPEKLNCFRIIAESINPKFDSKLESYYNTKYGFVELKYTNIDKSTMHFKLVGITSLDSMSLMNWFGRK